MVQTNSEQNRVAISAPPEGCHSSVFGLLRGDIDSDSVLKILGPHQWLPQTPLKGFLCNGWGRSACPGLHATVSHRGKHSDL